MSELWKEPRRDESAGSGPVRMGRQELHATLAGLARAPEQDAKPPATDDGHQALAALAATAARSVEAPPATDSSPATGDASPAQDGQPAAVVVPLAGRRNGQKSAAAVPAALEQPTIALRRRPVAAGPVSVSPITTELPTEAAPAAAPAPAPAGPRVPVDVAVWAPDDDDILPRRQPRGRRSWRHSR